MDRIHQLKQFALEEPDDAFNRYALALEYLKTDPLEAGKIFEKLMSSHPDYLPTYYPYAQLKVEQKDNDGAERVFQLGITMAKTKGEVKTLKELQAAYGDWKYEIS